SMLPADAFKGGFMSRILIIAFPENWSIRVADPPSVDEELKKTILKRLEIIANLRGEIKWTSEAKAYFESWYHLLRDPKPGPRAAYLERKQDHLLRLAVILQLAKSTKLILEKETIAQSLHILESVEPDTLKMVDFIAIEPRMRAAQRILEILEEAKGSVSEGELLNQVWGYLSRAAEFAELMFMLLKTKRISIETKSGETYYYARKER
ncbi:MAG: hypothetical protein KKB38_20455, partial [Gammaproteobacteria bacterium]|nr:hypothetical protein [Gammaproteobacteria bacterium]